MAISSKPKDGEPIVERQIDALGNAYYIATRQLITFFDDLAKEQQTLADQESLKNLSEISQLKRRLESTLQETESKISAIESEFRSSRATEDSRPQAELAAFYAKNVDRRLSEIELRLSSVEQTAWR